MTNHLRTVSNTGSLVSRIAEDAGLLRKRVWCRTCQSSQVVEHGLRDGWPKCCGFTMTIDHPDTWKK